MGKIEDLQQLAVDLQSSIDVKQDAIAAAIAAFKQTISDLQAIIDAGGGATEDQLQAVIDQVTAAKNDLEATPTA